MIIVFILAGILVALAILIKPYLGLIITVALMPQAILQAFSGSLFGVFSMATPIKVVGGLTFVSTVMQHILKRKNLFFLRSPQIRFYILFCIWILISGFSQPGFATRENFTNFASFTIFGFIIFSLVDSLRKFKIVLWTSIITTFLVSQKAVLNFSGFNRLSGMSGTYYGANEFAIFLLPVLGIAFYTIFVEKKIILKALSIITTLSILVAVVATFSRGAIIGLSVMFLISISGARKKIIAFIFATFVLILFIKLAPPSVWEKFEHTSISETERGEDPTVSSTTRRLLLARAAWNMFLDQPLIGAGIGNYYYGCRKYEFIVAGRAHSMYLEIMAELGIIGFSLFLMILFFTLQTLKKLIKQCSLFSLYAKGLYIGLLGFLVAAIFLHAQQEKILWFVIFMAVALENIVQKQPAFEDRK